MTGPCPRRLRLLGIATTGAVLLVACAPSSGTPSTSVKPGGKVTVASWQEQDSLLACNIMPAPISIRPWKGS